MPINVTLLFSREQYIAAAEAYMRGIERRIAAGLDPKVASVASLFVSRWDVAVKDKVPDELRNRLGIAIAKRTYKAYRDLLASPRWRKLAGSGARPQRLLWASTGTKDPQPRTPSTSKRWRLPIPSTPCPRRPCTPSPSTVEVKGALPIDGGDAEEVLAEFAREGVNDETLAAASPARGHPIFR